MFKTKYRIVTDTFCGYEAQYKLWWFPFWLQCFYVNSKYTLDDSILVANYHKKGLTYTGKSKTPKVIKVLN